MDGYIMGLDPGSKIGYAVLDLDGNLIDVNSFKGDLDMVIKELSRYGKILIVGTDVMKVPKSVKKVATQLGAKVISPKYDLFFYEKRKKTKEYLKKREIKLKDKHQRDALAAALVAFRQVNGLFNRIDNEIKDEEVSKEVKKLVILEDIPIKHALRKIY
ncbi:MAG: DUF460 domain-containing protein [Candidatus Woesearchaeota archaeon]